MKIHKLQNSCVRKVQQEQRKQEETGHEKKPLCLPCTLFPFLYICPVSIRLLLAGKERNSQAVTETQGETCKADDSCSSQVAENVAQRCTLQIWAALTSAQSLSFSNYVTQEQ